MKISLTPKQQLFFDAVFSDNGLLNLSIIDEFVSFGGFGSAKSFIVMVCTFLICLKYPNTQWLYARSTYPQLEDSVIKQFIELFPPDECGYTYNKQKREARFNNGSVINFRAFDVDTKILSNQYMGASLCQAEELPEEFFLQLWGRLRNRKNGIPKNIMLLEGNPAAGWCKRRYKDNPLGDKIFFIESTTYDNPFNPTDYVKKLEEIYPQSWIRRYVYGEWENYDELVFSEFSENRHVITPFEIPSSYYKIIGFDYGYKNPSAMVWLAIDYDGRIFLFDEFYETEQSPEQLSAAAKRHGQFPTVIDYSTRAKDYNGKSLFDLLCYNKLTNPNGLHLIPSTKDKTHNIALVNALFKQDKLFIFSTNKNTIHEIKNYKWKKPKLGEDKNLPEEVIKKDDHLMDAKMYGIAYISDMVSIDPKTIIPKNTLKYHLYRNDNELTLDKLG